MGAFIKILLQSAIPFFFKWLSQKLEVNEEKRGQKKEALNEVKDGIKKRDPSKVTAGFDRFNSVK